MDVDLILFKKDGSRKTFSLRGDSTIIGRHDDCDLRIPLKDVSRKHCQINQNNESLKIRDLGSRNGTFINGKRLAPYLPEALHDGDQLQLGKLLIEVELS